MTDVSTPAPQFFTPPAQLEVWALVELMGHRSCYGRIAEISYAGATFILIDQVDDAGNVTKQQMVQPTSVYAITPVTREIVTKATARPPALMAKYIDADDDYDGDDEDHDF